MLFVMAKPVTAEIFPRLGDKATRTTKASGLAFQITSYNCNTGELHVQVTGGDGSAIFLNLPGLIGQNVSANMDIVCQFPGDALTGRRVTGTATQSGNQIQIDFTNSCTLSGSTTPPSNPNPPTNPTPPSGGSLAFQITSYNCNTGELHVQVTGGNGSAIFLNLPGLIGQNVSANMDIVCQFPGDALTGRRVTGTATQSGNQIQIDFTNSCTLSGSTTPPSNPNPPTNPTPPSGGGLAFQITSYNCNTGELHVQVTGGNGSAIFLNLPGLIGQNVSANTDIVCQFPSDALTGRRVTGTATQSGNQIQIDFTNSCTLSGSTTPPSNPNPPSNPPSNPNARLLTVRPLSPTDPNRSANWNWTDQVFANVYYDSGTSTANIVAANGDGKVTSPFWDGTQALVGYRDQSDMYPDDGWMLVARDFGTSTAAQPYPFFALYNKYKGKLRIAFWQSSEKNISSYHSISLSFQQGIGNLPPSFLYADTDVNHGFINQANSSYVQKVIAKANRSQWMVGDFDVSGYSNQDFNSSANFNINIADVDESSLSAVGDITLDGSVQPKSNGKAFDIVQSLVGYSAPSLKAIGDVVKKVDPTGGYEKFATPVGGVLDFIKGGLDLISGLRGNGGGFDVNLTGNINLNGTIKTLRDAGSIPIYLKPQSGDFGYSPVQSIPWGVIGVVGIQPQDQSPIAPAYHYTVKRHFYPGRNNKEYVIIPPVPLDIQVNPSSGLTLTGLRVGFPQPKMDSAVQNKFIFPTYSSLIRRVSTDFLVNNDPNNTTYYASYYNQPPPNFQVIDLQKISVAFILKPNASTRRMNDSTVIYRTYAITPVFEDIYHNSGREGVNTSDESIANSPYPNPFEKEINIPIKDIPVGDDYDCQIQSLNGTTIWSKKGNRSDSMTFIKWQGETNSGDRAIPGMYICCLKRGLEIIAVYKVILQP